MVPVMKIPQAVDEVHTVPLPDVEEDDKRPSTFHRAHDRSDFRPWTKRNTAILTGAAPEPLSSSVSPSVDDKIDPDVVVDIGPSNSASMNIIAEGLKHEQTSASSYLPDMTTPSPGFINDDGTANADLPVSIIALEDTEERRRS
ncbi:hypothetical protein BDM02DRAFT_254933 [Thelephora ganbajun]|uniref:Uncharacterized protein n=1 Tax=Thelephora ganbajun TaxID=370292 RepID=A0ACB6Z9Q9_THEGA|nr:hypothetical protein BDM02DRAFT_254933 [Thelephora ganbajun]